ncbi:MAG: capsular polysaccharide biosynthesis protein [Pseudomonadota bacterium]
MTTRGHAPKKAVRDTSHRARLFYFNGGFFTQSRVRRILDLAGYDLRLGKPGDEDQIAVWGWSPTSGRGAAVGEKTGAKLVHIEDAFLRSIKPGRDGEPPLGLTVDHQRPYFDSSGPSDLETLLMEDPLDDAALLRRARDNIARIKALHLSKYNDFDPDAPLPDPGYVLVIDQTRGDASIEYGAGSVAAFREMLVYAQQDHPGARILIKTHPETAGGHRQGHFGPEHLTDPRISLLSDPVSPHALLEGAIAVYTVSSGMGFDAILAGHKPVTFGQPFYAGWGLTHDHQPIDRRTRTLTRTQLFAGAMMLYPKWYDPYRDRLCELERSIDTLHALTRAHRQDRSGHAALGMSLWKRKPLQDVFGPITFCSKPQQAEATDKPTLVWASKAPKGLDDAVRIEDGFLRSRGLGADLIAPLSLVTDRQGIYYDPTAPSDLEQLIAQSTTLPEYALNRAEKLRQSLIQLGVTKYNLGGSAPEIDAKGKQVILVPGQVEDDASIRTGTTDICTNDALLAATRRDYPDAFLIYKPHPDIETGLRDGKTDAAEADMIAPHADPLALLRQVDRVATMTSLLGFEALIRSVPVTCYGAPFYAGWGLTEDKGKIPARRTAQPTLLQLIHASLIAYPRYYDPITGLACPPEVTIERLASGTLPRPGLANRSLAKLQGWFSGFAPLWRPKRRPPG